MEVKVVERWVEEPGRSREAREYLRSLVRYLALRRLLGEERQADETERTPG